MPTGLQTSQAMLDLFRKVTSSVLILGLLVWLHHQGVALYVLQETFLMPPVLLPPNDLEQMLHELPQWRIATNGVVLSRDYLFDTFSQAFGFMTQAALHAERLDHHPDWSNVYNRVHVRLSTHEAGGITVRDVQLARIMERIAQQQFGI